jgi:2',3'-cyclic-nucleotide 2'-phosphodiesterase (5'-nucleotidase family)
MARLFPWIDVIVGGHTHTQLKGDEMENGVLITQNRNKLRFVTHTTLILDSTGCSDDGVAKWHVADKHSDYINVPAFSQRNKTVEQMVAFFSNSPELRRVLAHAETPFEVPEELGCMICDAFKEECQADIAVVNPGGIRIDSLSQGDITVRDVFEIDPFDNHAVVLTLTGEEIARMMLSYCHNTLHSFPYVGGMTCEITLEKDFPEKINSIKLMTLDGKKLNMKKKYKVATNNYIPATSEVPKGVAHTLNLETSDIIMSFLEKKEIVNYQGVKRLKTVPAK